MMADTEEIYKEIHPAKWTELANDIQVELSTILLCFFLLTIIKSSPLNTLQAFKLLAKKGSVALLFICTFPGK